MCLMTRPSRDDDRDCVKIDSQALSEDGVVVKVSFKAWRYITKEVLWEVRSVLDDFFPKEAACWETARVLKKQMGHVKEVCEMLGLKFWGEFIPNHKSYAQNKDFYDNESLPTKFVREEFSVTTLGLIVWLVTWSENRSRNCERDRLRAMLTAFFSSELDPSWFFFDRLVNKYNGEFDSCPPAHTADNAMPLPAIRNERPRELLPDLELVDVRRFLARGGPRYVVRCIRACRKSAYS